MTNRLTITAVNRALEAAGHPERLFKGKDYFYFAKGRAHTWYTSSVCVYRLNDLSLEQWIEERNQLAGRRQ